MHRRPEGVGAFCSKCGEGNCSRADEFGASVGMMMVMMMTMIERVQDRDDA
jgi:hypothetical protein